MRGLEMILPLPSASMAEISRLSTRVSDELNSDTAKLEALKPFCKDAGKLTKSPAVAP